jgi:hypothetical protein
VADLNDVQAAGITKIIGADTSGVEQTPVASTSAGALHTNLRDSSGTEIASSTTTPDITALGTVVRPLPYEPTSYSATSVAFVSAASATDVFTITGSASKTIRIHKVKVSGTTTSGSAIKITAQLIKRSTLDTGGTSVVATGVAHDSNSPSATAVVRHYTANPTTLGTTVGVLRADTVAFTGSGITGGVIEWNFEDFGQPVVLRGVAQNLAVNFSATTITGPVISISVEWSEI